MTEEGSLKSTVKDYLQLLENQGKLWFTQLNAGGIVIEGEKRRYFQGVKRGTADFEVIMEVDDKYYGRSYPRAIFLELKSEKGKQTKEQKEFEQSVKDFGCEYHIVRTLEELESVLK